MSHLHLISLILVTLSLPCISKADSSDYLGNRQFTHVLSWGPWNGSFETVDEPSVFLDGKSIGTLITAYQALNSLDVGSQDSIKIEIPVITALHQRHRPIYWIGRFLSTWVTKGAHLYLFQGDQEYKLHTLTWSKYLKENGAWKDDLTTAHLVLDNKDIGQIDVALNKLKQIPWDKDTILQIYLPYIAGGQMQDGLAAPDGLFATANQLGDKYGMAVEVITPSE